MNWLGVRYGNLVCGPHEDAHMFVDTAFTGGREEFWEHVEQYTDELPDDTGKYGRRGVEEFIWELAFLGNCVLLRSPEGYDEWPESFYQGHFELDLGDHDERP